MPCVRFGRTGYTDFFADPRLMSTPAGSDLTTARPVRPRRYGCLATHSSRLHLARLGSATAASPSVGPLASLRTARRTSCRTTATPFAPTVRHSGSRPNARSLALHYRLGHGKRDERRLQRYQSHTSAPIASVLAEQVRRPLSPASTIEPAQPPTPRPGELQTPVHVCSPAITAPASTSRPTACRSPR